MNNRILLIFIIALFIIVLGVFFLYNVNDEIGIIPGLQADSLDEDDVPGNDGQSPGAGPDDPKSAGAGGGGGSGGSGEGGEGGSGSCTSHQISYSVSNLVVAESCNEFQGETCVDKTATCSVDVQNFDYQNSADFDVSFIFFEDGNSSNILGEDSDLDNVGPRDTKAFDASIGFSGADADKTIDCIFQTQAPVICV